MSIKDYGSGYNFQALLHELILILILNFTDNNNSKF